MPENFKIKHHCFFKTILEGAIPSRVIYTNLHQEPTEALVYMSFEKMIQISISQFIETKIKFIKVIELVD